MRIITISRQFGSGGRELGKRLSDLLDWDYYDEEILETLAQERGMTAEDVRYALSHHGWHNVQLTYKNSFSHLGFDHDTRTQLLRRQRQLIEAIPQAGNDCIIVGRDADVILRDLHPLRLHICADFSSRLDRCMAHENKRPQDQRLNEREVARNIRRIDKNRARTREILTGKIQGDGSMFDLTVNAGPWEIKALAEALSAFAGRYFAQRSSR